MSAYRRRFLGRIPIDIANKETERVLQPSPGENKYPWRNDLDHCFLSEGYMELVSDKSVIFRSSEEVSFNSTFGEFNSDFLTAVHSIEQHHQQPERPSISETINREKNGNNIKEKIDNKNIPYYNKEKWTDSKICGEIKETSCTAVLGNSQKLKKKSESKVDNTNVRKHCTSSKLGRKSGTVSAKNPNKENRTLASPDLSDVSLCSPLHISTPTNTFKKTHPHKLSQGVLLSNTLLSQCTRDKGVHKVNIFANILDSPESGIGSGSVSEKKTHRVSTVGDDLCLATDSSRRKDKHGKPSLRQSEDKVMEALDDSDSQGFDTNHLSASPRQGSADIAIKSDQKSNSVKAIRKEESANAQSVLNLVSRENKLKSSDVPVDMSTPDSEGEERLQLSRWGLPEEVLAQYGAVGITCMFPWQADCLCTGNVLGGGNLVYSAPTSAGKTLVAELLMLKRVLETRRKAIMILPFVSVAREKMHYLQRMFQDAGIRVEGFMGSQNPSGGFQALDIAVCTIEKANSLINRLLEDGSVDKLGAVVVDELHMVGDSHRGYLLELLLTKVRYVHHKALSNPAQGNGDAGIQIIGMSATLPNLSLLATWLEADLYHTDFRPVPLTEMVKLGPCVYDRQMELVRRMDDVVVFKGDDEQVIPLCLETIYLGCSVLIFCPTKNWCEKLADSIAREFYSLIRKPTPLKAGFEKASELQTLQVDQAALRDVCEQLRRSPVGLDQLLGKTIPQAVAYHHAGLTFDERDIVEGAFRNCALKVLIATSTLSSGVNLPARRVLVRTPTFHGKLIDVLTYKQMVGRAGRKGVDTCGESVLLCKSNERSKAEKLLTSELPPVTSCLQRQGGLSSSMKRAILEVVVSGVASTPTEVQAYAASTMLAAQLASENDDDCPRNLQAIDECIQFLLDSEFVSLRTVTNEAGVSEERYVASQLGAAVLASALSPDEGLVVFTELQKARRCFVLENELHIIYLVTPIYMQDALGAALDWYQYLCAWESLDSGMRRVAELVGVSESYLAKAVRGRVPTNTVQQQRTLNIHKRFHVALVLHELVNEVALGAVAAKYKCSRGVLQSLQQAAATFAGMVTVFCQRLGWVHLELLLSQFSSRLTFGVQRELVDLVRVSLLNGHRARIMYNAGLQTVAALANAEVIQVEALLKKAAPFSSKKAGEGESAWEAQERQKSRCIWVAGQKGLTEYEAAVQIVEEARTLLQQDLGEMGVEWTPKQQDDGAPKVQIGLQTTTNKTPPTRPAGSKTKHRRSSSADSSLRLSSKKSTPKVGITCGEPASIPLNASILSPPPSLKKRRVSSNSSKQVITQESIGKDKGKGPGMPKKSCALKRIAGENTHAEKSTAEVELPKQQDSKKIETKENTSIAALVSDKATGNKAEAITISKVLNKDDNQPLNDISNKVRSIVPSEESDAISGRMYLRKRKSTSPIEVSSKLRKSPIGIPVSRNNENKESQKKTRPNGSVKSPVNNRTNDIDPTLENQESSHSKMSSLEALTAEGLNKNQAQAFDDKSVLFSKLEINKTPNATDENSSFMQDSFEGEMDACILIDSDEEIFGNSQPTEEFLGSNPSSICGSTIKSHNDVCVFKSPPPCQRVKKCDVAEDQVIPRSVRHSECFNDSFMLDTQTLNMVAQFSPTHQTAHTNSAHTSVDVIATSTKATDSPRTPEIYSEQSENLDLSITEVKAVKELKSRKQGDLQGNKTSNGKETGKLRNSTQVSSKANPVMSKPENRANIMRKQSKDIDNFEKPIVNGAKTSGADASMSEKTPPLFTEDTEVDSATHQFMLQYCTQPLVEGTASPALRPAAGLRGGAASPLASATTKHPCSPSHELLPFDAYDHIQTSDLDIAMTSDLQNASCDDLNLCLDGSNSEMLFSEIHTDALKIGKPLKSTENKTSASKTSPVSELFKPPISVSLKYNNDKLQVPTTSLGSVQGKKTDNNTQRNYKSKITVQNRGASRTCSEYAHFTQSSPKLPKEMKVSENTEHASHETGVVRKKIEAGFNLVDNTCSGMDDSFTFSMVEQCLAVEEIPPNKHDVHISSKTDMETKSVISNKVNSSHLTPASPLLVDSSHTEKYSQLYKLTPGTEEVLNAILDDSPMFGQRRTPSRKLRQRTCLSPSPNPLASKPNVTKKGKIAKQRRKSSSSINISRNNSANSSINSNVSDCLPPTPPECSVGQSSKVNTPSRLIGGTGMTPTRGDKEVNKTVNKRLNTSQFASASKTNKTESEQKSKNVNKTGMRTATSDIQSDHNLQDKKKISRTPQKQRTKPKKKRLSPICSTSQSNLSTNLPLSDTATNSKLNAMGAHANHDAHVAVGDLSALDMPLTNEGFCIVDVAASQQVFDVFMREWRDKKEFSICVACEKRSPPPQQPAIGANFSKAPSKSSDEGASSTQSITTGFMSEERDVTIVGVAVCCGNRDTYYISLTETPLLCELDASLAVPAHDPDLTLTRRVEGIKAVLQSSRDDVTVMAYDIKDQYKVLSQACGIQLRSAYMDPKVAAWLLDPGAKQMNLHRMVTNDLPLHVHLLDGISSGVGYGSLGMSPGVSGSGRVRACVESVLVFHLTQHYLSLLAEKALTEAFTQVEMPALLLLAKMELNGFGFSERECEAQKSIMLARLSALEQQAYSLAGHTFSLSTPEDVAQVLFIELKLPPTGDPTNPQPTKTLGPARRNVRGRIKVQYSTAKDILEKLKPLHPLPGVILEWRRISCALSKVVFPLQKEKIFNERLQMERIHGVSQTHTATGRVSMQEPNLQNVPKDFEISLPDVIGESPPGTGASRGRSRGGKAQCLGDSNIPFSVSMRHAFVPFKGGVILAADYSQLELRIIAHLSRDNRLIKILNEGGDVFRTIAAQWKGVSPDEVTVEERQQAKQVCYGMIYGIGAKALGEQLKVGEEDAAAFMDSFKARYIGMRRYLRETVKACREQGFVQTLMGRRRYLPAITSTNSHSKAHAERQAVNTTVQGSAADLVKKAMVDIDSSLSKAFPQCMAPHTHLHDLPLPDEAWRRRSTRQREASGAPRGAYLLLQLHDELIYEVHARDAPAVSRVVRDCMQGALTLSVQLPVKVKVGPTWGTLEDCDY